MIPPNWKDVIAQTLTSLKLIEIVSQQRVDEILPLYSEQQQISQIVGVGGLPEVAAKLGSLANQLHYEGLIQGRVREYRAKVNQDAMNAGFYFSHNVDKSLMPMPSDLAKYLVDIQVS